MVMTSRILGFALVLLASCAGDGTPASSAPDGTPTPGTSPTAPAPTGTTWPEPTADAGPRPLTCEGSGQTWKSLVPGPGQTAYDAALADAVRKYDRFHESLGTLATGLSGNMSVNLDAAGREELAALFAAPYVDGDYDATDDVTQYTKLDPKSFVTAWGKTVGLYGGAEVAADAFRYGVLRDGSGTCTEVRRARAVLERGLDAMHVAVAITGVSGSIARSIGRNDLPGDGQTPTVALFDAGGKPLPAEKNNGTWRKSNAPGGQYANLSWEDSCSRDMMYGWTLAMASAWEVIKSDPTISAARKTTLQADAKAILDGLRIVRPSGKDLELWDPDGRRTYHGNFHETSVDRQYLLKNGIASLQALGLVAGLAFVAEDAASTGFVSTLIGQRGLASEAKNGAFLVALGGEGANHSNYNMLFTTGWLAVRYVGDANANTDLRSAVGTIYDTPNAGMRPSQWKQSLYDMVFAASSGAGTVAKPVAASYDAAAVGRGVETLTQFPKAPFFSFVRQNCTEQEVAAKVCTLEDGTVVQLTDGSSWNGNVMAKTPLPLKLRPPSNYYWRSNPFEVNGGEEGSIFPGSDLRLAYWLGRYVRVAP